MYPNISARVPVGRPGEKVRADTCQVTVFSWPLPFSICVSVNLTTPSPPPITQFFSFLHSLLIFLSHFTFSHTSIDLAYPQSQFRYFQHTFPNHPVPYVHFASFWMLHATSVRQSHIGWSKFRTQRILFTNLLTKFLENTLKKKKRQFKTHHSFM